ncbi:MAG: hypothetical protein HY258_00775 [Chloroflexi bacterium]|nr:hypothetical protein [Chloroflexota bacterium]
MRNNASTTAPAQGQGQGAGQGQGQGQSQTAQQQTEWWQTIDWRIILLAFGGLSTAFTLIFARYSALKK